MTNVNESVILDCPSLTNQEASNHLQLNLTSTTVNNEGSLSFRKSSRWNKRAPKMNIEEIEKWLDEMEM